MSDDLVGAILIKHDIKKLVDKLDQIYKQNFTLQKRLFWLTIATTVLAFIQTVVIITQIFY